MIDLSVVIVNYETADLLIACLDALAESRRANPRFEFEVIVVDNGSRDASVDRARSHSIAPRLVAGIRNRGFAAAVNSGLRLRKGRHVLLLNSDVEIEPDLLVQATLLLDEHEKIGILGPALVHMDGRPQRSVHRIPSLRTELVPEWFAAAMRKRRTSRPASGRSGSVDLEEVEAIRGAVFFVRGDLIEKVGSFDEGYFFFLEETDYCVRVHRAGYRVAYCASLRAVHRLGASSKRRAPLATRIEYHRSLYRFLGRRSGSGAAFVVRLVRGLRNTVTVVALAVPALLLPRVRDRWTERAGLLLWHLRGCPAGPALVDALVRAGDGASRGDASLRARSSNTTEEGAV